MTHLHLRWLQTEAFSVLLNNELSHLQDHIEFLLVRMTLPKAKVRPVVSKKEN